MKLGGTDTNWDKISTEYEPLPEGEYNVVIEEIEEGETPENKLPQLTFKLVVQGGDYDGRKMTDFVTLKTNKGKRNDIGFGRIKAYQIAVHGEGSIGDGIEIDTDELQNGSCTIVVKNEAYTNKKDGKEKMGSKVAKVLPLG